MKCFPKEGWEKRWLFLNQTKDLAPLKMRISPITTTDRAATLSPISLVLSERSEAESPLTKRTGTVPRPKKTIVENPPQGFSAVAALTSIAQDRRQGRNPVANPKATLEINRWD